MKGEYQSTLQNEIKHYLRRENKINGNKVLSYLLWDIKVYVNKYVQTKLKTMKKLLSILSNLQSQYHFKLYFQKQYYWLHVGYFCMIAWYKSAN